MSTNKDWLKRKRYNAVLEIIVGDRTVSDQILKMRPANFTLWSDTMNDHVTSTSLVIFFFKVLSDNKLCPVQFLNVRPNERSEKTYVWIQKNYFQHCDVSFRVTCSTQLAYLDFQKSTVFWYSHGIGSRRGRFSFLQVLRCPPGIDRGF